MSTILGFLLLGVSLLLVLVQPGTRGLRVGINPRAMLFGLIAANQIRPGDEDSNQLHFFMEKVPFSLLYTGGLLAVLLIFYRRFRLTTDRFHWAVLLFFLAAVNSAIFAPCFGPAASQIDVFFKSLLLYYFICAFIRDEPQMRTLYWAVSAAFVTVALRYCYGKFVLGENNWEGATGDRNEMAMSMNMVFPFLAVLGLTATNKRVKLVAFGSVGLVALTCLFSLSRGGMLGLGAVAFYMLYRLHHKRWLVALGIVVVAVGLANMPPAIVARFNTIGEAKQKDPSAIGRLNAWGAARNILADRPLTGMGVGNFLVYFRRYAPDPDDIHVAHSSFYQTMGDQGYPGLAIWIYLVLMLWLTATWVEMRMVRVEQGRWTEARYMMLAMKASWIGYALCGSFLSQQRNEFFFYLLAICSRYTVFVEQREAQVRAERRAAVEVARKAAEEARVRALTEAGHVIPGDSAMGWRAA